MVTGIVSKCFTLLFIFTVFSLYAGDTSPKSQQKIEQTAFFSSQFIKHYTNNNIDSIVIVLRHWERETGMNEALFRANALYLVQQDRFPGQLLQYGLLEYAIAWEIRHGKIYETDRLDYFQTHTDFFSYIEIGYEFDRFTINAARRLLARTEEASLANAFMKLYAGNVNDFFHALPEGKHSGNLLGYEYQERYNELIRMPETHMAVAVGAWMPDGPLSVIGIRPSVGVKLGRMYNKLLADIAFDVRFGKSDNIIDIPLTEEVMLEVDHFIGMRAALIPSYNIIKRPPNTFDVFLSAGYEWIELVKSGQDRRGNTFSSPSLGMGLTYRHFFANRLNIGLSAGYYMLWFDNPGGTSLDGNALKVSLSVSFLENPRKRIGLNRFGINYW